MTRQTMVYAGPEYFPPGEPVVTTITTTTEQTMTDEKTTALALAPIAEVRAKLESSEHRDLIKQTHCPGATDLEFAHCMGTAHHLGLDPIARQIFFIPVWDNKQRREQWVPIVSIDGLRAIAQRTGEWQGRTNPQWCGPDGQWVDIWLADTPPAGARVGVYRAGFREPLYGVVTYREYCRRKKDGAPMALWATHPSHMLFKTAEAQAYRAAFPREMAGDYGIKDISMPGEPGRFRVRDTTDEVAEQVAPKELPANADDGVARLLEQIRTAQTRAELDALVREAATTPEASRPELRKAWVEAKARIGRVALPPEAVAVGTTTVVKESDLPEHDYGPAPMTDAEVAAVESGEQGGFGFDGGKE